MYIYLVKGGGVGGCDLYIKHVFQILLSLGYAAYRSGLRRRGREPNISCGCVARVGLPYVLISDMLRLVNA